MSDADAKLYPEEPDERQAARLALRDAMDTLDDVWSRRATRDVTDGDVQQAIDVVNQAGKTYADTF